MSDASFREDCWGAIVSVLLGGTLIFCWNADRRTWLGIALLTIGFCLLVWALSESVYRWTPTRRGGWQVKMCFGFLAGALIGYEHAWIEGNLSAHSLEASIIGFGIFGVLFAVLPARFHRLRSDYKPRKKST